MIFTPFITDSYIINFVFSADLPTEKTPFRRAGRARAPRGAVKIEDFCGGDKRAFSIVKRSFTITFYRQA
jgi:hypothetical protein